MDVVTDIVIPAVTFLFMVAVGHGLTPTELRRSATDLRAVATGTFGQLTLLPAIATVIVLVIEPPPPVTAGLILVAASPSGTLSNFYSHLSRANSALSITLTVVSCLVSFATLPMLVTAGFFFWLDDVPDLEVPTTLLVVQLLVLVALPVCLGLAIRRWRPHHAEVRDRVLRQISLAALVGLVAYVIFSQWPSIVTDLDTLVAVAVVFTVLAMAAGYTIAWATGRPVADRLTFLIEFPCRNLALAIVVAATSLGRPDVVGFAAVLLLVQSLLVLTLVAFLRHETSAPTAG
ncbi:MAG: bile acid:sodium symporter [Holophagae bacterium]|jgi:BASS family bile acid:Na+ symporter